MEEKNWLESFAHGARIRQKRSDYKRGERLENRRHRNDRTHVSWKSTVTGGVSRKGNRIGGGKRTRARKQWNR